MKVYYKSGYKYQLDKPLFLILPELWENSTGPVSVGRFIRMDRAFMELAVSSGYAWDGPSGPTLDTPSFIRGSLVHDVLYQLIRNGQLPESFRKTADEILIRLCKEDGMPWWRRKYVYAAVRWFGKKAATKRRKVHVAP